MSDRLLDEPNIYTGPPPNPYTGAAQAPDRRACLTCRWLQRRAIGNEWRCGFFGGRDAYFVRGDECKGNYWCEKPTPRPSFWSWLIGGCR